MNFLLLCQYLLKKMNNADIQSIYEIKCIINGWPLVELWCKENRGIKAAGRKVWCPGSRLRTNCSVEVVQLGQLHFKHQNNVLCFFTTFSVHAKLDKQLQLCLAWLWTSHLQRPSHLTRFFFTFSNKHTTYPITITSNTHNFESPWKKKNYFHNFHNLLIETKKVIITDLSLPQGQCSF